MKRATMFAIWTSAVIALAVAVISSSRTIAQRSGESTFSADDHRNESTSALSLAQLRFQYRVRYAGSHGHKATTSIH
jgi:hypothetical protein